MKTFFTNLTKRIQRAWGMVTIGLRHKPDFIIIGTQKGGTTSLFYYLSQHPELSLPKKKELHYYSKYYHKGKSWYVSHFPIKESGKQSGESTPYYLFHPMVAERLKQDFPNVKLLVMLREPVARAYSHYQMELLLGNETDPDFKQVLLNEATRLADSDESIKAGSAYTIAHAHHSYIARGQYAEQLERWFNHFDKDQFLFIKSENFFAHPQQELDRICNFLKISNYSPGDLKPKLVGEYDQLSPELKSFANTYFEASNERLTSMLGPEFKW